MHRIHHCPLLVAMLLLRPDLQTKFVGATFSIVATDNKSRQIGGAGASCNPMGDVFEGLYLSAPNRSVLHTQALLLERNSPIIRQARNMMEKGDKSIQDILSTMEDMDSSNYTLSVGSFPSAELRQYGMADFTTNGGFTGKSLETAYTLAGIAEGTEQIDIGSENLVDGRFSYHAMGNVVAEGTVEALQAGFLQDIVESDSGDDDHCKMAKRLMAAMDSVLQNGFGDMRCMRDHNGISSTGAYLHVDEPDGRVLVHINKPGDGSYEPIEELKREFLQWQKNNGCHVDVSEESPSKVARVQPKISNTPTSSSDNENAISNVMLATVGLVSGMLVGLVGILFGKVKSYIMKVTLTHTEQHMLFDV